jgi:cytochrome c biogenesis protein CcmG/thiol:disulfide interchange protein DsbE
MNWRRSLIGIAIALPIVGLLAYGMTLDPDAIPVTMPGKDAPVFALPVMDAAEADSVFFAAHRGQVLVLNFWASWCIECRHEHTDLSMTAAQYEPKGVRFYGVLYKDSQPNARDWIRSMGGQTYPTLVDDGSRTAVDYGVSKVPETVVIDQKGVVVYKHLGPITAAQLAAIIDPLLAPQPASTPGAEE